MKQRAAEGIGGLEIHVIAHCRMLLLNGQPRAVTLTYPETIRNLAAVDPKPQRPTCMKPEALHQSTQTLGVSRRRDRLARPEDGKAAHSVSGAAAYMHVPIDIHTALYMHAHIHAHIHKYRHACMHACIHNIT